MYEEIFTTVIVNKYMSMFVSNNNLPNFALFK